ncbi:MAG: GNAT family N-acetyltransferase [Candidatus Eisenbacteria bacterium]|nr:GNAT family N-acetyltransferase [Candidatus Eisenbacteria bacterium]
MRTEVICEKTRFEELAGQWEPLSTGVRPLSPALSHEWFSSWIKAFGAETRLSVVAVFDEDRLMAVAPLQSVTGAYRGIPCAQLRFLSNRHAPRCAFLVREGRSDLARLLIRETLALPGWDLAVLDNVPHGSLLFELAAEEVSSGGFLFLARKTMSSPLLRLEGSWAEFFGSRPRNLRRSLHNKENRIAAAGKVEVQHITDSAGGAAVMDTLFRIGEASWKAPGGRAIGSGAESRRFYCLLAETFGGRGELSVWLMRLDGEPVAFEFHITRGKRVQALRAEFDEKRRELGVGSVLDKEIIRQLFELGFEEYDMGGEADFYKLRWTTETTQHSELLFFRRSGKGRLLHALESRLVEPAKQVLRPRSRRPRGGGARDGGED